MVVSARQALIDGRIEGPTTIGLDEEGRITEVRPRRAGDPEARAGLLLPGLVNAHLHLELSWAAGRIPAGLGFEAWLGTLLSLRPDEDEVERGKQEGLDQLLASGTAAVSDICNGPSTVGPLAEAGCCGVVQRELFGLGPARQPALMQAASRVAERLGAMVERPSPHALYSMHPALLRATIEADGLGVPASIHVAEDPGELQFLRDGTGPFAARLKGIGIDWRGWTPPGCSPIEHLDRQGLLHDLLLVHGVHLTDADRQAIASSGCPLVLCPRSNLHIGGALPDVPALLAAHVPLALGTDSLASCADLDVLNEVEVLCAAFPDVPLATWLHAVTSGGAAALGVSVGRLAVGTRPKLLLVHPQRPWTEREVLVG